MPSSLTKNRSGKAEPRYSVGLTPGVATQVARYARQTDTSVSKAIAALVQIGLERRAGRKEEFLGKLKANLEKPGTQEQPVDEFRDLILGR